MSFILPPTSISKLPTIKPRIPEQINTISFIISYSSHYERTYLLIKVYQEKINIIGFIQECYRQTNTISFDPTVVTIRELTICQVKVHISIQTPLASIYFSHNHMTYSLSSQECQKQINTISIILVSATTMIELTSYQVKNTRIR
jgi:hypothetical protein